MGARGFQPGSEAARRAAARLAALNADPGFRAKSDEGRRRSAARPEFRELMRALGRPENFRHATALLSPEERAAYDRRRALYKCGRDVALRLAGRADLVKP